MVKENGTVASCGDRACEFLIAVLYVVGAVVLVVWTYCQLPSAYENLSPTTVLSMLVVAIATSLAAIGIVAAQRDIVIHDDQKSHKALIDRIKGGREQLVSRMCAVSFFAAYGLPLVIIFVTVLSLVSGGKIFGSQYLSVATMLTLVWFCCLTFAISRLELAIMVALSKKVEE